MPCTCGEMPQFRTCRESGYVVKFWIGLNQQFSQVRSQIMLLEPIPTITEVFTHVIQQQRKASTPIVKDGQVFANMSNSQLS